MEFQEHRRIRFVTFAVVALMVGALVVGLFGQARAVSVAFDGAPTSVTSSSTAFFVNIQIDASSHVPIQSIDAIVEKQASVGTKAGATLATRASCPMSPQPGFKCPGSATLTTSGPKPNGVRQIEFVGAFLGSSSGAALQPADIFGYAAYGGTTTGYGYTGANGYGSDLGGTSAISGAGSGYGYGYGSGTLVLRYKVTVDCAKLSGSTTHYLTVLARTGSGVIGDLSSKFTQFQNKCAATGTGGGGGGGGGDSGGTTIVGTTQNPTGGQQSRTTATIGTRPAGTTMNVITSDPVIGEVSFTLATATSGATVSVAVYPPGSPPPGVPANPVGTSGSYYVEIVITGADGAVSRATFAISLAPADAPDPTKGMILREVNGVWVPQGRADLRLGANGRFEASAEVDCCSFFVLVFDTMAPEVQLTVPEGQLQDTIRVSATATDNILVDRVEFYVDNFLAATVRGAPFHYDLATATFSDGQHTLRAVAYDAVDSSSDASAIRTFQNGVAAPPGQPPGAPVAPGDGGIGAGLGGNRAVVGALVGAALLLIVVGGGMYALGKRKPPAPPASAGEPLTSDNLHSRLEQLHHRASTQVSRIEEIRQRVATKPAKVPDPRTAGPPPTDERGELGPPDEASVRPGAHSQFEEGVGTPEHPDMDAPAAKKQPRRLDVEDVGDDDVTK